MKQHNDIKYANLEVTVIYKLLYLASLTQYIYDKVLKPETNEVSYFNSFIARTLLLTFIPRQLNSRLDTQDRELSV